jgi:hypothetical protein
MVERFVPRFPEPAVHLIARLEVVGRDQYPRLLHEGISFVDVRLRFVLRNYHGPEVLSKGLRHAGKAEKAKAGIRKQVSGNRIQVTGEVTVFTAELQLTKNPLTSQKVQTRT